MDEGHLEGKPSAGPPNASASTYPLKELADRIRIPNVKASFGLVKGLSAMVADGKIIEKMTGLRIIVFPTIFTLSIWTSFQEILGRKLAPKVITAFHRDTGKIMVEVGKRNFKLGDKFAFEFYFWLLSAIGWGEVKKFEFDDQKIEGTWQMEYKGSLPRNTLKGVPLHDNWRGEIMAAAEEAFHVPIDVRETKCVALGDPYCEFKWGKSETQDKESASVSGSVNLSAIWRFLHLSVMLELVFERWRTPPGIVLHALHLYFGFKLSSRDVRDRLREELGYWRSHEAVCEWVQRTNRATRRYFAAPLPRRVHRIIMDESEIRVGGEWVWLWAALEPTRRVILEVHLSPTRNGLVARSFMAQLMEKYGRKVTFLTDGGKWYPWAARSLGARWRWVRGGVRSYIERWFRTIKDRMHVFNSAFPRSADGLTPALTFIRFYAFYYNEVRPHRTLRGRTPIPTRRATRLQRLQHALEVTRNP